MKTCRVQSVRLALFSVWFLFLGGETRAWASFIDFTLVIQSAQQDEKDGDYLKAEASYRVVADYLQHIHTKYPDWETVPVEQRLKEYRISASRLEPLSRQQVLSKKPEDIVAAGPSAPDEARGMRSPCDWGDLTQFEAHRYSLEVIHREDPNWRPKVIEAQIQAATNELDHLWRLAFRADKSPLET